MIKWICYNNNNFMMSNDTILNINIINDIPNKLIQ